MNVSGIVKRGEYYDSITIMLVAKQLAEMKGVVDSAIVMGTKENRSLLASSGLSVKDFAFATDTDLLIAVKADGDADAADILEKTEHLLASRKRPEGNETFQPQSIEGAVAAAPDANFAMISVAGKYAADVAMQSLQQGLHVMLFSDNVTIDREIELKQYARERQLFVMGPDCGTAIINGVPLAFANVVERGNIGIVAASGTGLQEVSCLISNAGCGISQAIGTGGRDIKKTVGGIMFIEGIRSLASDEQTEVILLVSKPPDQEVLQNIIEEVNKIRKPVVSVFLNSPPELCRGTNISAATTLEEGALSAVALFQKESVETVCKKLTLRDAALHAEASGYCARLGNGQKYLRALFSGGTFCDEALMLSQGILANVYSNIPFGTIGKLPSAWKSVKHTIIDLGDDEFTVGKPHPMIDYSARCKRIVAEAEDPETAIILFDIVLGYGSHSHPLTEILPAIGRAREIASSAKRFLPVICSVTGTDHDPQKRNIVVSALADAGVIVKESNAAASKLAIFIAGCKEKQS